jgi:tripartite-type tricarboxylate transporter receptor subunit TctC
MNRRDLLAAGAAAVSLLLPRTATADYPERPIRLVVPFAPGGVVDVVARLWADKVRVPLGTVVIENQGGGGGIIGTAEVARAQPDGHTLLLGNTSIMVIIPAVAARVPYDPIKDFTPVSIVAISATSIIVHPSVPAQTLREFMDYARANSGKLVYGSAGAGTLTNLTGEMFKQFLGATDIVHVPYRGAGPGISDLVSGHIPMMTPNITGQLLDLHRAGRLRILAVTSPQRLKGAPEIPTAVEAGMPDLVAQLFNGLFVPAGTPEPIVDRIAQLTHTVLADAEFQAALIKAGLEPVLDSDPEKARRFVNDEHLRLTPMIKAAGLKLE